MTSPQYIDVDVNSHMDILRKAEEKCLTQNVESIQIGICRRQDPSDNTECINEFQPSLEHDAILENVADKLMCHRDLNNVVTKTPASKLELDKNCFSINEKIDCTNRKDCKWRTNSNYYRDKNANDTNSFPGGICEPDAVIRIKEERNGDDFTSQECKRISKSKLYKKDRNDGIPMSSEQQKSDFQRDSAESTSDKSHNYKLRDSQNDYVWYDSYYVDGASTHHVARQKDGKRRQKDDSAGTHSSYTDAKTECDKDPSCSGIYYDDKNTPRCDGFCVSAIDGNLTATDPCTWQACRDCTSCTPGVDVSPGSGGTFKLITDQEKHNVKYSFVKKYDYTLDDKTGVKGIALKPSRYIEHTDATTNKGTIEKNSDYGNKTTSFGPEQECEPDYRSTLIKSESATDNSYLWYEGFKMHEQNTVGGTTYAIAKQRCDHDKNCPGVYYHTRTGWMKIDPSKKLSTWAYDIKDANYGDKHHGLALKPDRNIDYISADGEHADQFCCADLGDLDSKNEGCTVLNHDPSKCKINTTNQKIQYFDSLLHAQNACGENPVCQNVVEVTKVIDTSTDNVEVESVEVESVYALTTSDSNCNTNITGLLNNLNKDRRSENMNPRVESISKFKYFENPSDARAACLIDPECTGVLEHDRTIPVVNDEKHFTLKKMYALTAEQCIIESDYITEAKETWEAVERSDDYFSNSLRNYEKYDTSNLFCHHPDMTYDQFPELSVRDMGNNNLNHEKTLSGPRQRLKEYRWPECITECDTRDDCAGLQVLEDAKVCHLLPPEVFDSIKDKKDYSDAWYAPGGAKNEYYGTVVNPPSSSNCEKNCKQSGQNWGYEHNKWVYELQNSCDGCIERTDTSCEPGNIFPMDWSLNGGSLKDTVQYDYPIRSTIYQKKTCTNPNAVNYGGDGPCGDLLSITIT